MLPGWPALCLVCQGEGLFGLHQKGLWVCGRDTDKDQAGLTLVQISETALGLYGHVLASKVVIVESFCLCQRLDKLKLAEGIVLSV